LYGIPPKTSADYAFISHALASLNETGRGIVLVADGSLFRGGAEGKIRHNMIASDVIEAIISLPGGIFQHTNISVNLIIFIHNIKIKQTSTKQLFIYHAIFTNIQISH